LGQVSPSIEPLSSSYYVKKLAKGSFTYKNPYLKELLKFKDKDSDEVWKSILLRDGSVQHLDFLNDHEKSVFKTFREISPKQVVIQNIQRQRYIDQSISLNLMIPSNANPKDVSKLLIFGWENGIKTFYYQRSTSAVAELNRNILSCESCSS
jgi:ribonucleoside-diphosphate reductase alpha chain